LPDTSGSATLYIKTVIAFSARHEPRARQSPVLPRQLRTGAGWIGERYDDLLAQDERHFLATFHSLPQASRALFVRMVMRKGTLFRASKLVYEEIGSTQEAALPLANGA
jgi:hypothetical protein